MDALVLPAVQDLPRKTPGMTPGLLESSIVVPTIRERDNVGDLVRRLHTALRGIEWEVIFVDDDSPDATADVARALALHDSRVRCIQRIGRHGLSSARIEGVLSSSASYVAVTDAELQHDERILPTMLEALRRGEAEIAIGSRYIEGDAIGEWDSTRAFISRLAPRSVSSSCPRRCLIR